MTSDLRHSAARLVQRGRRRRAGVVLRSRIGALRQRPGWQHRPGGLGRRTAGRITPIERVMRRSAVHVQRSISAAVHLHARWSGGVLRHTQRRVMLQTQEPGAAGPVRRLLERRLVTQRVVQERLLQRLAAPTLPALPAAPAMVTRVEHRQLFPRVQLTLVRTQPPAPSTERREDGQPALVVRGDRPATSRPRGAAAMASQVLAPQELSRLTDHVIRQLDHRVLSWQERTGRA